MALIDYASRFPEGDGYQSLSVIGSAGAAYVDDHQNMQLLFRGGRSQAVRAEESGRRHSAALQERVASLQAGHGVAACIAEWHNVLNVVESVQRSTHSVAWARVPVPVAEKRDGQKSRNSFRCAVLSAVKHDYVARGMATHPRFELVVVADDSQIPDWAHERNQQLADAFRIPYIRDVERALREFQVDVAIVSPEAERHCDLSIRAARSAFTWYRTNR